MLAIALQLNLWFYTYRVLMVQLSSLQLERRGREYQLRYMYELAFYLSGNVHVHTGSGREASNHSLLITLFKMFLTNWRPVCTSGKRKELFFELPERWLKFSKKIAKFSKLHIRWSMTSGSSWRGASLSSDTFSFQLTRQWREKGWI